MHVKSSYGRGSTVIRNKQQVFLALTCCSITFHIRPETVTRVRYGEHLKWSFMLKVVNDVPVLKNSRKNLRPCFL